MKVKLKVGYLGQPAGKTIEVEEAEGKNLVSENKAGYLLEVPKAQNKVINMRGKRKYKVRK